MAACFSPSGVEVSQVVNNVFTREWAPRAPRQLLLRLTCQGFTNKARKFACRVTIRPSTTAPQCAPGNKSRTRTSIPIAEAILMNSPIKNAFTCTFECTLLGRRATNVSRQAKNSVRQKQPRRHRTKPIMPRAAPSEPKRSARLSVPSHTEAKRLLTLFGGQRCAKPQALSKTPGF